MKKPVLARLAYEIGMLHAAVRASNNTGPDTLSNALYTYMEAVTECGEGWTEYGEDLAEIEDKVNKAVHAILQKSAYVGEIIEAADSAIFHFAFTQLF